MRDGQHERFGKRPTKLQMMLTNCERNGAVAGGRERRKEEETDRDGQREGREKWRPEEMDES